MKYENDEYLIDKKGCFKKVNGKDEKLVKLASPIFIVARYKDPIHKKEQIIIQDQDGDEYILDSSILSSRNLFKLIEMGFSINENHIKELSNALQDARNSTVKSSFYKGVGVMSTNKGTVIVLNDLHFSPSMTEEDMSQIICDNKYDLMPNGNLNDWLSMFKEQVNGNVVLELVATFGVSALVTRYLFFLNEIEFTGIIYSLTGQSSSGKTTAAMLAASIAGNPNKGDKTLFCSWNATKVGIENNVSSNFGVPVIFDELSTSTIGSLTNLLYSISEGQGRERADKNGNTREKLNWGTSIISTGEYSIFNNSAKNDGLRVRIIEINDAITSSSSNSDAIKKVVRKNYGHVLPIISDYLLNNEEQLVAMYEEHRKWFEAALANEKSKTGIRMISRYAVILTSATVFECALDLNLNKEEMKSYLLNYHENTISERSLTEKAMEAIIQYIAVNTGKFSQDRPLSNMIENNGTIIVQNDYVEVKIIRSIFERILKDNGFEDAKNVIKALDNDNKLVTDKDRKTNQRKVKNDNDELESIVFYHIKIDKKFAETFNLNLNFG
ncbi:cassette chromosome replicative helicase [Staphylococcus saprophyticus]|uniref:cassette chromosome replicative helicase n=1 Tax=Staphylococcus saprophyticus TaxID=29385 RepID=UPI00297B193A|nr:DUF927 domain-containing protein [Staphylococcus saprophyticus]MDW4260678.1 DUF927 domain-containing protein [Staphylococcus saprophyticus]